jgi:hypothetical protein
MMQVTAYAARVSGKAIEPKRRFELNLLARRENWFGRNDPALRSGKKYKKLLRQKTADSTGAS